MTDDKQQANELEQTSREAINEAMLNEAYLQTINKAIGFFQALQQRNESKTERELMPTLKDLIVEWLETQQQRQKQIDEIMNRIAFDNETIEAMREAFREVGQQNVVYLTMLQYYRKTSKSGNIPANDDVFPALKAIATAYTDAHGGLQNLRGDNGFISKETEAELHTIIREYLEFHNSSGADSYQYTAKLFIEKRFPSVNPSAIVVRDRLTAISILDFQFALTTRPNPRAFIAPLGTGMFTKFRYDEKKGQVIDVKANKPVQETQTPEETAKMMKNAADTVSTPDFVLLIALYGLLISNAERFDKDEIVIPIKAFTKEYGIGDLTAGHARDFEKIFDTYKHYVGWINGKGLFPVLLWKGRDDEAGTMTFSAPYLYRLIPLILKEGTRQFRSGRKSFLGHNELVHTTIYKEQNQTAAAMTIHICNLLFQNAQQPDKGRQYVDGIHVTFSTLADYAELSPRLERITTTREKTRTLRNCVTKALELLRTQTDAYQYFTGLELYTLDNDGKKVFATITDNGGNLTDNLTGGKEKYNAIAPTFAGYNTILYIRHKGANKHWKHDV